MLARLASRAGSGSPDLARAFCWLGSSRTELARVQAYIQLPCFTSSSCSLYMCPCINRDNWAELLIRQARAKRDHRNGISFVLLLGWEAGSVAVSSVLTLVLDSLLGTKEHTFSDSYYLSQI
jgi:hypothetical protein